MLIKNWKDFADSLGVSASTVEEASDRCSRAIYKATACGAWCKVTDAHVLAGSIVEGSDAEVNTDPLKYPFYSVEFQNTINYIESEAEALWNEANDNA